MTFVEQLVQKKTAGRERLMLLLIWGGAALICLLVALLALYFGQASGQIVFSPLLLGLILIGFVIFGAVWLSKSQYIEFEYSVYEGELDIDKISGKRRRKRIVQVPAKRIETLEPCTDALRSRPFDRVVMAAPSPEEATWCVTYQSKKNGRTLVMFAPTDRTLNALLEGLPPMIQRECERKRQEAGL